MALLSAIISLLSRKIGDLLQAIFGWSIIGLFGRLSSKKQTALSVALILALAWPFLIAGAIKPEIAAWGISLVPLHEFVSKDVLRIIWLVLAVLAPIGVAALTRWAAPPEQKKSGIKAILVSSVPLTIGFAVAFLITLVIVPVLKVISMARGWDDDHVYVLIEKGRYRDVLAAARAACASGDIALEERPVPLVMALPLRVLKWFARGALSPIVAEDPRMLESKDLTVYLYPGDMMLRGKPAKLARVRALLVMQLVNAPAHLVEEPAGQRIETELHALWTFIEHHAPREVGPSERARVLMVAEQLSRAELPLDQWSLLRIHLDLLERAMMLPPNIEVATRAAMDRVAQKRASRPSRSTQDRLSN